MPKVCFPTPAKSTCVTVGIKTKTNTALNSCRYSCGVTGEVAVCGRWTLDSVATCDQSGKSRDFQDAEKLGK